METQYGGVKTKQQMAAEYGVCRKTFNKLLKRNNIKLVRGLISPRDQIYIYKKLGRPNSIQRFPIVPKSSV
jgi:hypothetical protein